MWCSSGSFAVLNRFTPEAAEVVGGFQSHSPILPNVLVQVEVLERNEVGSVSVHRPTVKLNPQPGSAYARTGSGAAYVVVVITGDGNVNG